MTTVSPAMAITEAAEAARPSTTVSTVPPKLERAVYIARPSKTSPPGLLMRTRTLSEVTASSSPLNALAMMPNSPISS